MKRSVNPLWRGVGSQPPMDECRKASTQKSMEEAAVPKAFYRFSVLLYAKKETGVIFFLPFRFYSTRSIRPIHRIHYGQAPRVANLSMDACERLRLHLYLFVLFFRYSALALAFCILETPSYSSQSRLLVTQVRSRSSWSKVHGRPKRGRYGTASLSLKAPRSLPPTTSTQTHRDP